MGMDDESNPKKAKPVENSIQNNKTNHHNKEEFYSEISESKLNVWKR